MIERADERVKYAQNRDPAEAIAQAQALLDNAESLARTLEDPKARAGLLGQVATRRADLSRLSRIALPAQGADGEQ